MNKTEKIITHILSEMDKTQEILGNLSKKYRLRPDVFDMLNSAGKINCVIDIRALYKNNLEIDVVPRVSLTVRGYPHFDVVDCMVTTNDTLYRNRDRLNVRSDEIRENTIFNNFKTIARQILNDNPVD